MALPSFGLVALASAVTLVVYNIYLTIYRLYFHPLAKFPGPKLAAITGWDEFYRDVFLGGKMIWRIQELHDQYGPIVRIAPDELHIRDADFYDKWYISGNKGRDKWSRWTVGTGAPGASVATISHAHHRLRRSALNPFFSKQNIRNNEPQIKDKISRLFRRFRECKSLDQVVRMDCAYMALTMDIITDFAFGIDYEHLNYPDFNIAWKDAIVGTLSSQPMVKQFPWMLPMLKAMPLSMAQRIDPLIAMMIRWSMIVRKEIDHIIEINAQGKRADGTIFQVVLDSDLPPEEKTAQRLEDESSVVIGAGSETTARCLSVITYYLTKDRSKLQTLRDELTTISPEEDGFFSVGQLESLPYLNAVIMEGMRLTGVVGRLPRTANEPVVYNDQWTIPANSAVSMANYHTHHDPKIFPEPLEFSPERWLEAAKNNVKLEKYLVTFGRGTRACIGINLAWTELYMTLAHTVARFDFEIYDTEIERDIRTSRDYFIQVPREDSQGIRMTIKEVF